MGSGRRCCCCCWLCGRAWRGGGAGEEVPVDGRRCVCVCCECSGGPTCRPRAAASSGGCPRSASSHA